MSEAHDTTGEPTQAASAVGIPSGLVSFVGAGPGAPDLITIRGADRLRAADIVIWASSLVPEALLAHANPEAELHDSASLTLEDVLELYTANPDAAIVRLHSGDPSIYGAMQEQIEWCVAAGRRYEIVPGVSSLGAAAAASGVELTVPGISQSVVITRLANRTSASVPPAEKLSAFAATGCTLGVFLSAARPEALAAELLAPPSAYTPDTPAVIVVRATWPDEVLVRTTIASLADDLRATGATTTVLVLVGEALRERGSTGADGAPDGPPIAGDGRSHLYSPSFAHSFRKRSKAGSTRGRPATGRSARRR
ncbi:MAG: precorrin-4 C(11)-methyltransferase [Acidimicrobiales bacterium]